MRGTLAVLLLLALLVPGCTRERSNPYDQQVAPDSDLGEARIVVQGDQGERVGNATVLVQPAGMAGKTDHMGFYMARNLRPGTYSAVVNADGYFDGRSEFQVQAGALEEVVVFVDRRTR